MTRLFPQHAKELPPERRTARTAALFGAFSVTAAGAVYFVFMLVLLLSGRMTFPPDGPAQDFGGISTLLAAVLLPVLFVSVHWLVPEGKRVLSALGVVFCAVFSALVSINRFAQLSVVRLSILEGNTEGLARFLPYDGRSVLFALEMAGWGIFLSLALFCLALALQKRGLLRAVRWIFFLYAALGLTSAVAFAVNSPLSVVGFAAWGLLLFTGTGLLLVALIRYDRFWTGS